MMQRFTTGQQSKTRGKHPRVNETTIARMRANFQISSTSVYMKALIRDKITLRPVSPDEASEIVEMLETDW